MFYQDWCIQGQEQVQNPWFMREKSVVLYCRVLLKFGLVMNILSWVLAIQYIKKAQFHTEVEMWGMMMSLLSLP